MRLQDKVTIITGAADGIGLACAERFCTEGAKVVLADIDDRKGKAQAKRLTQDGFAAEFAYCDVSQKADVERLVEATVAHWGRLDGLVANAGVVHVADFLELAEADFDRVLGVNLKGVFLTGQVAARQMAKQGTGGTIVNMSSVNGVMAIPRISPYVASKGGVNQLTKVMSLELIEHGIRVNAIGPGSISTELVSKVLVDDGARKKVLSRTPMGRLGEPDEVAKVAVFLASDDSSYVTGQVVYVDGGRLGLNYTVAVDD